MCDTPSIPQDFKEPATFDTGVIAIEYTYPFDVQKLEPRVGNIYRFFIHEKFFVLTHPPIAERGLYGCTYYAPHSDLTAIAMHFGCIFTSHKRKATTRRRLSTVRNALEICLCSEGEYHRRSNTLILAPELDLRGVVVTLCIDHSPSTFPQVMRNGIRSREFPRPCPFCLRISHFYLVTGFDEMPRLVPPGEFIHGSFQPIQRALENGEVSIPYSPLMFLQIFTRLNIANGIFSAFRIFLLVNDGFAEVVFTEGTRMKVMMLPEGATVSDAQKRRIVGSEIAAGEIHLFEPSENALTVSGTVIGPIHGIVLVQGPSGKTQRSKDKLA